MRVLQGRADTIAADHNRTDEVVAHAVETGEPALRVWTPHPQVAFGRRDARTDGYERARELAEQRGYPAIERAVGGRAVAFSGSTLAVVHAEPDADRTAIQSRYDAAIARFQRALDDCGVTAREGEPADSFCPGTHSLQADGKLAGLAQRVRSDVAITAGVVVVRDHDVVRDVLAPVYDALGVPFDPETVGSVVAAGGPADPDSIGNAIVAAFTDRVRET